MAKDILDAIRQAEDDAKAREAQANDEAQKRIAETNAKAKQLIADAQAEEDKNAEKRYEIARADGDAELEKGKKTAESKCAEISQTADKNREGVIDKAVDFLLS